MHVGHFMEVLLMILIGRVTLFGINNPFERINGKDFSWKIVVFTPEQSLNFVYIFSQLWEIFGNDVIDELLLEQ